jgi:uncharacterized membrane protein YeaQ/YmgE (transglycosylase-associated protein family)
LPFAVGVYLPLASSVPIFVGGLVRWAADKFRRSKTDGDSSPGVLLGSGYIAGAAIAQVIVAFLEFKKEILTAMDFSGVVKAIPIGGEPWATSNVPVLVAFGGLTLILFLVGTERLRKSA